MVHCFLVMAYSWNSKCLCFLVVGMAVVYSATFCSRLTILITMTNVFPFVKVFVLELCT
uniref:Uncharacterized protein n=1 Tax=Rhizophora mucronata TaxID=61149 RepID=A0A2P2QC12_RHIMU